jgi:hypothetical protein
MPALLEKLTEEAVDTLYRNRFGGSMPILLLMQGGMKGHSRMSREDAFEVCRAAAESGVRLEYEMDGLSDLA